MSAHYWQVGCLTSRQARQSGPDQLLKTYKRSSRVTREHANRFAVPHGEAEGLAGPHSYLFEKKFGTQVFQYAFDKIALTPRSAASRDQ